MIKLAEDMKIIKMIRRNLKKEIKKIMKNEIIITIFINKNHNILYLITNINMKINLNQNMTNIDNKILILDLNANEK